MQLRPWENDGGGKYRFLSSVKYGGSGPGSLVHVPLDMGDWTGGTVRVTEGFLKADAAFFLSNVPTLGVSGTSGPGPLLELLKKHRPAVAMLSFDMDRFGNADVASAMVRLADALCAAGIVVQVETWNEADGKGIDDVLHAGKPTQVLAGPEADAHLDKLRAVAGLDADAAVPTPTPGTGAVIFQAGKPTGARYRLLVQGAGDDCHEANRVSEACSALAVRADDLYQQRGRFVRVLPADDGRAGRWRVAPVPPAALRTLLTRHVEPTTAKVIEGQPVETPCHPPRWLVEGLDALDPKAGVRPLDGIVSTPILRPDGSARTDGGYDELTRLYLDAAPGDFPPVPVAPSRDDARRAADELRDVTCDFPFLAECHRTAWLACVLTMLGRHLLAPDSGRCSWSMPTGSARAKPGWLDWPS